jgi:predicted MFS family arabinose efflux permease
MMDQSANSNFDNESSISYPGWGVAAGAFVGVMTSFAPIIPYTFSLFLNPLHETLGWRRESISIAFGIAAITVSFVSPLIGLLLDRFPPRRVILPCIVIFALSLASLSRLGTGIGRFYLTFFVMGLVANGTAQFAYTRTMLTWFQRHRGFALALILTGSGVGSIIYPPLTQWTITHFGWRDAFVMLGGIALLGFPLTAMLVRNKPAHIVHREVSNQPSLSVGRALASAPFWVLAGITILSAFSENGLVTNLAPILTQHGIAVATAALALSFRGGAGIIGRLLVGFLVDRLSPQRIQTAVLALAATGSLILIFASTGPVTLFGATLLGIGLGSEADVGPYLLARYCGRKHFSVLYGLMWTAYALGGGTAPVIVGHYFDRAGAYPMRMLVVLVAVAFGAAGVSLFLKREHGGGHAEVSDFPATSAVSLEE